MGFMKLKLSSDHPMPWWMAIVNDSSIPIAFISSKSVPEAVTRNRPVDRHVSKVPGARYSRSSFSSIPSEDIDFSIRIVNIDRVMGASTAIAFFELLSEPLPTLSGIDSPAFTSPGRVLYCYGINSAISVRHYLVNDVRIEGREPNLLGIPQQIDVSMKLTVDPDSFLYTLSRSLSFAFATLGGIQSVASIIKSSNPSRAKNSNPYYNEATSSLKSMIGL